MGLYLAVFSNDSTDEELDGVDVGSYENFAGFRQAVATYLEDGNWGSRFPVLMSHSDSDGSWSASEAAELEKELDDIGRRFEKLSGLRELEHADAIPTAPPVGESLTGAYVDADGQPLIDRIRQLAHLANLKERPILFQ